MLTGTVDNASGSVHSLIYRADQWQMKSNASSSMAGEQDACGLRAQTTSRVSEMAAKFKKDAIFKDHWQIRDGLLERYYTPETVLYRLSISARS